MRTKKVIFIGGTSYSGSTFFDMMLASGESGFSAGEVYALFYPHRPHHINPPCGCGDPTCTVWQDIKRKGATNLYQEIFKRFPEVRYIVDSSKDPIWIARQSKLLAKKGLDVQHILIYKTPIEFAHSKLKRNNLTGWDRHWKNYHKLYFSVIGRWVSIKYSELASNPSKSLENLCKEVGVRYFKDKELYWNFTHHTLFGNNSAKVHLYSEKSVNYEKSVNNLAKEINASYDNKHRTIYYNGETGYTLNKKISEVANRDPEIALILNLLEATEKGVSRNPDNIAKLNSLLRLPSYVSFLYKINSLFKRILNQIRKPLLIKR